MTEKLTVRFRGHTVGSLSFTPDNRLNVFEYDKSWITAGFSISPFELPLKPGIFIAKPQPFYGNFGIFEDSLPDGYGRYLLHKALRRKGINDSELSSLDRLAIVGDSGMGALTYSPAINLGHEEPVTDFDRLQQIALEVLKSNRIKTPDCCSSTAATAVVHGRRPYFQTMTAIGLSSSDIHTTLLTWVFRNTTTIKRHENAESLCLIFDS